MSLCSCDWHEMDWSENERIGCRTQSKVQNIILFGLFGYDQCVHTEIWSHRCESDRQTCWKVFTNWIELNELSFIGEAIGCDLGQIQTIFSKEHYHVDDVRKNFLMNPQNGLKIKALEKHTRIEKQTESWSIWPNISRRLPRETIWVHWITSIGIDT